MNNLRQVKDISEYHAEPDAEYWLESEGVRRDINIEDYHVRGIRKMIENGELHVKSTAPTIKAVWMRHPTAFAGLMLVEVESVEKMKTNNWHVVNVEVMSDV